MKKIFILYSVCYLFMAACGNKNKAAESTEKSENTNEELVVLTDAQAKNAGIVTGKLETKAISNTLKVNGLIDVPPQNLVSVSMPLGGYLRSTKLLPGMHVSKGEIIAVMEDQQYIQLQQDYLLANTKLQLAELEFQRQNDLNQSKASSDKALQQADAELKIQKTMFAAFAQKLKLININPLNLTNESISKSVNLYAPINGFVSKINANIGKYITPSDVLFDLINPTDIHLNLKIFEKDVRQLFIGQKLITYTNNQPNIKHICEIILISKDLSADHTVDVHCHFKDYDKNLLPGMYMNADIETKNSQANAIPEAAIVNFEGKNFVYFSQGNNQFLMTEVKTGSSENGFVELIDASELLGKNIVTKGAYTLLMKMKNVEEE
jgi:membrane fusion protein, heavy metal efflux system